MRATPLLGLALLLACSAPPGAARPGLALSVLEAGATGLSDLAVDAEGGVWALPERARLLVPIPPSAAQRLTLEGVPEGTDTESLAWLGPDTLALGGERQEEREEDAILLARIEEGRAVVKGALRFSYESFGLKAEKNRGIEGLCAAAGALVAAAETVGEHAGRRYAPLGRLDPASGEATSFRLFLSSKTGKISALACRPAKDGASLEVIAVERHFGVGRLLGFSLPLRGEGADIEPRLLLDLAASLSGELPNFEGVAFRPDGGLLLVSDSDYGMSSGKTWLLTVDRAALE